MAVGVALLLAWAASPTAAQGATAPWNVSDAPNDVAAQAGPATTPPMPPAWFTPYLDVTSLSIADPDEEVIEFRLRTSGGFAPTAPVGHRSSFPVEHEILFQAPESSAGLSIFVESMRRDDQTPLDPLYVVRVKLCGGTRATTGTGFGAETICNWRGRLDYRVEEGALVVLLPKLELTNRGSTKDQITQLLPPMLEPGMSLHGIRVRASANIEAVTGGVLAGLRFVDRAPNAGEAPPYVLRRGSPVHDLTIHFDRRGVIAGEENVLLVRVENLASHKRLVAFSVDVTKVEGDGVWTAEITPKATIGAGKTTNLTLRLRPSAAGLVGPSAAGIKVVGRILTEGGLLAITTWSLVASPPLGERHDRYYVHGFGVRQALQAPVTVPGGFFEYASAVMTRHEALVGSKDEEPLPFQQPGITGDFMIGLFATGQDYFPNAARFRPGEPITGTLVIDAPIDYEASLRTMVVYRSDQPIADQTTPIMIREGRHAYTFSAPPLPSVTRLEPLDSHLGLALRISKPGLGADLVTIANRLDRTSLVPKGSFLDLPLVREVARAGEDDLPAVFLGPAEDLETFINPGRRQVIEFDVRNEDPAPQAVVLAAENQSREWPVAVAPGREFVLGSNESVRVGFLVDAPIDAKEGDVLEFLASARSADGNRLLSDYRVRLIATRGVDIANETFEADDESLRKLSDHRSTPGIGVGIVFLVIAAAALRRRRL